MFESIKLRIIKGRKLNPFATAKVLQEHEDRLNALEGNSSEPSGSETNSNGGNSGSQESETQTKRNNNISVNDGTNAVEGASVSIGTITRTTGRAGGCTLKDVPDGEQTIEVIAEGFGDYEGTITVSESNTSFTISLTAVTPQS